MTAGHQNGLTPTCSTLELMPKWLICIPLTFQWLWLALRYGSATLPSSANPAITAGGLVGEGKLEYFSGMGATAQAATARYCQILNDEACTAATLASTLAVAGLNFPIIVKPDLGLCGYGVRLLQNFDQLQSYIRVFPKNEKVVLQEYLPQDGEAGIFYARDPASDKGQITGLALRYFPSVVGNGYSTIAQLVAAHPRARRLVDSPRHECCFNNSHIPTTGERVRLATIGSTRVGGLYRDGSIHITPELSTAIDAVAQDMPLFHFGRFDVRYDSLSTLRAGVGFKIMEINGAGSEAIQAWDPGVSVAAGFRIIFAKQRLLFAIGDAMRRRGVRPIGIFRLAILNRRQQRLIAAYPPSN
jgi:hypothetical protein